MRTILISVSVLLCASFSYAQKNISKTINTKLGQGINFNFDRADVNFTTWDKNEISITGTAKINNGENDDAFTIKIEKYDDVWNIRTFLKNECDLPKMISMTKDGVTSYLRVDKKNGWNNSSAEGVQYDQVSIGIITEIKLEVKVPQDVKLMAMAKFGDIDIENFTGELHLKTTHGHINAIFPNPIKNNVSIASTHNFVDVSILSSSRLNVDLKSSHGEMLTDLDLEFPEFVTRKKKNARSSSSKNRIIANLNGGGANLYLKATHNNVYLREYKR
ncbi:MAG: DUF4097 family beta strand repeat-containing protein [Saprospiraceae bacterium]